MQEKNNTNETPIAYQKGYIYFNDLKIRVNQNVLIPRAETEDISKYILNFVKTQNYINKSITILEVGTGSGCISIDLATKINNCSITAIDISEKALQVAKLNAKIHKVENKINFIENNLLQNINGQFNIIVANLPYIPTNYLEKLDDSVKNYEPMLALDGGEDGFNLYKKMFNQILNNKIKFDYMIIELDDSHIELAKSYTQNVFKDFKVEILKDRYKYDRFLQVKQI